MEKIETQINQLLKQNLNPQTLEVVNESYLHSGHAGADSESHFFVRIQCAAFEGKSKVDQHRMVYALLKDLIPKPIHALRLETKTPEL